MQPVTALRYLLIILALSLLLFGCNNREDALLPPNLSAADYLEGNKIESYDNFLVKCSNDDSYLLVDKLAITDSLLNYGDVLHFRREQDFASRDSIALQNNAVALSNSYSITVTRKGQAVNLKGRIPLGQVYTKLAYATEPHLISFDYYLMGSPIQASYYGEGRAFFPIYSTGDFAVYNVPASDNPGFSKNTTSMLHVWMQAQGDKQLSVNFPQTYCAVAGEISLSMGASLSPNEQSTLQAYYPNAAISTPIFSISTANPLNSSVAELWYRDGSKALFTEQWMRLAAPLAYTWSAQNPDTQAEDWWQDDSGLYSFLAGSGKYFLINPLESQTELSIPLDGSYNNVLLQDYWFDLRDINLPNTVMRLQQSSMASLGEYFQSKPFTLNGAYSSFNLVFEQNGSQIQELPDNAWLEFGFRTTITATPNDRLFLCYRDDSRDIISYKSPATSYDSTHYTRNANFVYCSMNSSGTYLYGSASEASGELHIPYYKSKQYISTSYGAVSWSDSSKRGFNELRLNLNPSLPQHPWLYGEPLTLTDKQNLAEAIFYTNDVAQNSIPSGFSLSLPYSGDNNELILYNNLSYPRLKLYHQAESYEGDTYTSDGSNITIYPEFPGSIISAAVSYPNPMNLRMYSTQTFVLDELRLYTYGNAPDGSSALLGINKQASLADPYSILRNQYNLSQSSPAYSISAANEADLSLFQPMLFFLRSRSRNLLFYERNDTYYRLYPYEESGSFSPWNFMIDGDYNGIALNDNGNYASFTEPSAHNTVNSVLSGFGQDKHLSLYQAQFVIPSYYMETAIPQNSTASLSKLSLLPGVSNLLAAYQLGINQPNGDALYPNFYTVVGAPFVPYIYLPVSEVASLPTARLFFRNQLGQVIELQRVQSFSDNYAAEYMVLGNCFLCTVPNPGIFYITR